MKQNKIYLSLSLLTILTTISWITSCTHTANIANIPIVCFEGDVLPIYTNNCAVTGCHDGARGSRMVFKNYADIRASVTPGNPGNSQSYQAIISKWGNTMPPNRPISLENRTIIRLWIEQGAEQTTCPEATTPTGQTGGDTVITKRACFTRDILPVLVSHCGIASCHDAVSHKEGYDYTSYTTTLQSVNAGNPGNSKLYEVIKSGSGENKMPPSNYSQLSAAEIDSIGKWIGYGALNETCGDACDTINPVTFSGTIWPVMQTSCTGCHTGASPGGGITLANYSNVQALALNGGLINSLKGTGVTKMPKGGSLSTCRIRQFEIWINNGSLNN